MTEQPTTPPAEHEPTVAELVEREIAAIVAAWDRAELVLKTHPDLQGALAAAGVLGDRVRELLESRQRAARGIVVLRMKRAGGGTIRKLAAATSLSRSAVDRMLTAAEAAEQAERERELVDQEVPS